MSPAMTRAARCAFFSVLALAAASCGGGGGGTIASSSSTGTTGTSTPTGSNVASVVVNSGPQGTSVNTLFTSITVCVPGTSTCQTIDNIQIDTGSYGLRLLASAVTLSLPVSMTGSGTALAECTEFVDGYSWGPLAAVDLQIGGETASAVAIQLIGDSRYPQAPTDCSNGAPMEEDTVASFGANGILGIGPFAADCGDFCETNIPEPAIYYACTTTTSCTATTVATSSQVQNPVTLFAADNNGTIIDLPSVDTTGAASVSGSLIFGIDTESNNQSGTQTVVPIATSGAEAGYLSTTFGGQVLAMSFIDSGSNALFFNDTNLSVCSNPNFKDFYCPGSTASLSAEFDLAAGATASESFSVMSAEMLNASFTAFPALAGTNPTSDSFDWGLPFFYGRRVATAIEGFSTTAGTGPYIAF
jgi:hypothetical protein